MENGARKKLRDITGRLRQVLENDFRTNTDGGESIKSKAWRWAIHLAVEQAMTVRGICGEMSDLSTVAACRLNDRPSAGAEQCCRDLLAGREEEPNPFIAADALGWLHQYWYDGERQAITAKSGGDQYSKITAAEIIPATQVYTEKYIVDFLLENSLGAFWMGMHPESALAFGWRYYVKKAAEPAFPAKTAATITVIDPACGCGNFLLSAFDLLYGMYLEESGDKSPEAICTSILNHNLFGIDIDAEAVEITRAVLWLKAKEKAPALKGTALTAFGSHIIAAGATAKSPSARELGSLLRMDDGPGRGQLAALLGRRYDVVVTNPPYVDKRDYSKSVRSYLRRHYPSGAGNLYAAFILRCLDLADGYVGMITPQTFLFLTSYTALRQAVFRGASFRTLAHLGLGTFEDAVVDTAMFVLTRAAPGEVNPPAGVYFKLLEAPQKEAALASAIDAADRNLSPANVFFRTMEQVTALDGAPVTYWLGDEMLKIVQKSRPLRDYADIVLGMKTSDNKRFVRYWWEIDPECIAGQSPGWVPYEKEASGYRFRRNSAHYVRWTEASREFYKSHYSAQLPNPKYWFQPGLVYGLVSSKAFTAKLLPAGHMADMAASCIYPHNQADSFFLLGILNSKLYQWLLKMFNPTVNYQPIDLQRLPVPVLAQGDKAVIGGLASRAAEAIGKVREQEITDRNYCFEPGAFLPLGEKMFSRVSRLWLDSLEYILARDAIDLRLAAALNLPESEYRTILAEMGGLSAEYPAIAGYSALPPTLNQELFVPPGCCVKVTKAELMLVKARLRQLYSSDWAKGWSVTAADFLEDSATKLNLHPLTVYHLITEGIRQEDWGGGSLEQRLAEDSFSAMILWQMGQRWPKDQDWSAAQQRPPVVPAGPAWGPNNILDMIRGLIGGYCSPATAEAEFAGAVGVGLETWLETVFFKRHISQFKRRPVVWQLSSRGGRGAPLFSCFVHHRRAGQIPKLGAGPGEPLLEYLDRLSGSGTARDTSNQTTELENFAACLAGLEQYVPCLDLGVRANIAPLQQAGILKTAVLSPPDADRAVADYRQWLDSFF